MKETANVIQIKYHFQFLLLVNNSVVPGRYRKAYDMRLKWKLGPWMVDTMNGEGIVTQPSIYYEGTAASHSSPIPPVARSLRFLASRDIG